MISTIKRSAAAVGAVALVTLAGVGAASADVTVGPPVKMLGACESAAHPAPAKDDLSDGVDDILVQAPNCVVEGAKDALANLGSVLSPGGGDK